MTRYIGEYNDAAHAYDPRCPYYDEPPPEPTDTVRAMLDRFGPVLVEYERKGAKVVGVFNSTGKDIYWLLNADEKIDVDYIADEAWNK